MKTPLSTLLICLGTFCLSWTSTTIQAADNIKIVFISGKPSHGPMSHEHRAGNLILAKALNAANLEIDAIVLPVDGYPKDPAVLEARTD